MADPTGVSYVEAFKLALQGVNALKGMSAQADLQKQAAELFEVIRAGQASALEESIKQRALLETVDNLKAQIAQHETWNAEKQRYALASPWNGALVRAVTRAASHGEPPHWICPDCYENGQKFLLRDRVVREGRAYLVLHCNGCKSDIYSDATGGQVERKYAEDMR